MHGAMFGLAAGREGQQSAGRVIGWSTMMQDVHASLLMLQLGRVCAWLGAEVRPLLMHCAAMTLLLLHLQGPGARCNRCHAAKRIRSVLQQRAVSQGTLHAYRDWFNSTPSGALGSCSSSSSSSSLRVAAATAKQPGKILQTPLCLVACVCVSVSVCVDMCTCALSLSLRPSCR